MIYLRVVRILIEIPSFIIVANYIIGLVVVAPKHPDTIFPGKHSTYAVLIIWAWLIQAKSTGHVQNQWALPRGAAQGRNDLTLSLGVWAFALHNKFFPKNPLVHLFQNYH
jgi:hypothetical protein